MDKDDDVLPIEREWGRLLADRPYGDCPDLESLEEIAARGRRTPLYEERMQHIASCATCRGILDQLDALTTQPEDSVRKDGGAATWPARAGVALRQVFHTQRSSVLAVGIAVILLLIVVSDRLHLAADQRRNRQLEQQVMASARRVQEVQTAREQIETQSKEKAEKIARLETELRKASDRPLKLAPNDKTLVALAQNGFDVRLPEGFESHRGPDDRLPRLAEFPSGKVLRETRPTFHWKKVAGAESYQVTLTPYTGSGGSIHYDATRRIESPWQAANTWQPTDLHGARIALPYGQKYEWRVQWRIGGKQAGVSASAAFETIDTQTEERLENSALASGVVKAGAGQIDDAERDFQSVLAVHPGNVAARRLIATLRAKRTTSLPPTP